MNVVIWSLFLIQFVFDLSILLGLLFFDDITVIKNKKEFRYSKKKEKPTIYLLIALFNESKGIENTLHWFSKFLSSNVKLVFVTTEKEKRVFGENKTLLKLTSLLSLPDYSSLHITVINYPFLKGNKGAQLNYAIRQMDRLMPDDYILVYDADSRPDLKTIDELSQIIQTKQPNVIQQSSLYLRNYGISSPYMKVEALFESIRAMGLERRNYLLKKANKYIISPFCYCVGHGMCFKTSFLKQIGLFPEPNEDVPIGIKVALLGESIEPMVTKDYCNVTNNVKMLFFQSGNWIKAPFVCIKTFFSFQRYGIISVTKKVSLFCSIIFDFLSWVMHLFLAAIALVSLFSPSIISPYFFLIWLIVKITIPEGQMLVFRQKYPTVQITYKEVLLAPFRDLFRGLAVFALILHAIGISYNEMGRDDD